MNCPFCQQELTHYYSSKMWVCHEHNVKFQDYIRLDFFFKDDKPEEGLERMKFVIWKTKVQFPYIIEVNPINKTCELFHLPDREEIDYSNDEDFHRVMKKMEKGEEAIFALDFIPEINPENARQYLNRFLKLLPYS